MWWIVVALQLSSSYAQITSPGEAVCISEQLVFVCQQSGSTLRWDVTVSGKVLSETLTSQTNTVSMFENDGFGFEIQILSNSSSASSIISELCVTAVRQLNGVTVVCAGASGRFMSTITLVDPPAAPSGVMTTADQSQFTPSTASITLTWSASSGTDNYTIMVTPLLPSGQSLVSTTTTSLQLTVLYNQEYSINITAQNCAGSNSTVTKIKPSSIIGCSPPSPPANGSFTQYIRAALGAMLTFQCDTGYMPQEEVTSSCMSNSSWVPIPECEEIDCSDPFKTFGGIIEPFNNTKFGALVTFRCEENGTLNSAVCGSNGEWELDSDSTKCYNVNDPDSRLNGDSDSLSLVGLYAGISVAILFLLILLTTIIALVVVVKKKKGVKSKRSLDLDSSRNYDQSGSEYAQTRHPGPRSNQVGEEYSVLCYTEMTEKVKPPSGCGDTLIYADLGPSSGKRRTPVTSNIQDDHRVVYSTVNHALQQVTKKNTQCHDKTGSCLAEAALDLDMLLIQLKPQVLTKWKQFAEAVGLSNIIKELSQYSEDECIVEVFDQWLKSHPTKPTWRNVADVLNDIGLQQLAKDILKVYQTGRLPIVVDMDAVPEMTTSDTETPPPLPPKIDNDDLVLPTRPPKPVL